MITHTKDLLAEELRKLGLESMAAKAAKGYYHDFMSPLATPALQLMNDLVLEARRNPERAVEILALRERAMEGDFDASDEEGEEWADTAEGRATMDQLRRGKLDL